MNLSKVTCEIKSRLFMIGKLPLCNQKRDRAPVIGNFVFLLCYRCTGIIIGWLLSLLILKLFILDHSLFLLVLFSLPCAVDGLLQKLEILQSNNLRRVSTGFLFGTGLIFL